MILFIYLELSHLGLEFILFRKRR